MIIDYVSQSYGPGLNTMLFSAFVWFFSILVVLYHRSGLQVIGGAIFFIGFFLLLADAQPYLSLSLLLIGFGIHGCGRLLFHLKRRG